MFDDSLGAQDADYFRPLGVQGTPSYLRSWAPRDSHGLRFNYPSVAMALGLNSSTQLSKADLLTFWFSHIGPFFGRGAKRLTFLFWVLRATESMNMMYSLHLGAWNKGLFSWVVMRDEQNPRLT